MSRLPVIIRIQEDCTPEVAAALDILHKEMKKRNLKTNGKQPLRGEEAQHDEIETAIIQALAPHQNTPDFGGLISKTNDYKQTLAHFAVLFGFTNLLKRLVGWNIDLAIADVNGFTALHCAYKMGDRVCVDILLEKGAPETAMDTLGRAPSHLMPEGFASLNDHDTDMTSDDQPKLEQMRDAPSPFQSADSGHRVSDPWAKKSTFSADLGDLITQSQSSTLFHGSLSHWDPLQRLVRPKRGISTLVIPPQCLTTQMSSILETLLRDLNPSSIAKLGLLLQIIECRILLRRTLPLPT